MRALATSAALLFFASLANTQTIIGIDVAGGMFAGSVTQIVATVMPAKADERPDAEWLSGVEPNWLALEFCSQRTDSEPFVPSHDLRRLLNPTFHKNPPPTQFERTKFRYWYEINIPQELAGQRICARLKVEDPPYGPIPMKNGVPANQEYQKCFKVLEANTKEEKDEAIATRVRPLYDNQDYEGTVRLVDSLLDTGWRSEHAISLGLTASRKTGNPHTELKFLDALFEVCGCVMAREVDDMKFEPVGGGSARDTAAYIWTRERLLKLIAEQKK